MRGDRQVNDGRVRNLEGDSSAGQFNKKNAKIPDFWKSYTEIAQKHEAPTIVQLPHTGPQSPVGLGNETYLRRTMTPNEAMLNIGNSKGDDYY